jgi:carboxylesterase type B
MSEDCLYLNVWTPQKADMNTFLCWYIFMAAVFWQVMDQSQDMMEKAWRVHGIVAITVNYGLAYSDFLPIRN